MALAIHLNHINKVLQSGYSAYQIHRETDISQSEVTELREHKCSPTNIRIANGTKLERFYKKHRGKINADIKKRQEKT